MLIRARRFVAACLLLMYPALLTAPAEAVCAHAIAAELSAPAPRDAGAGSGHNHGHDSHITATDNETGRTSGPAPVTGAQEITGDVDGHDHAPAECPMESGQTGCTVQVPLPGTATLSATPAETTVPTTGPSRTEPPLIEPASIFRPPRV